ncbi:MAG: DUF5606 domain-containing protein [Bacteroidales bacterium]|nr:DUF5606 domain-containing protein [Bacteroidales bacterium]
MIKKILSISGRPGLYKLISQGKNMLILETIDSAKKRMPVHTREKLISLGDIAMYTDEEEKPLAEILESIKQKENGNVTALNHKTATNDELAEFMAAVLPNYDRDRVHHSDIRKLIAWYNILITNGVNEFVEPKLATTPAANSSTDL